LFRKIFYNSLLDSGRKSVWLKDDPAPAAYPEKSQTLD
jgi:hypothetical protein